MANRDIREIDDVPAAEEETKALQPKRAVKAVRLVEVNYPEPTPLSQIVRDVSQWSGECFAMDPQVNAKLQIFAPHKMDEKAALDLFFASLSIVGLRAVKVGPVTKIVPVGNKISA